jgi:prepilin-type N-terminal cleavage/methylation domain-containing protein
MHRSDGFTLIEILVVVVIAGILLTTGYMQLTSFTSSWSLDRMADSISNMVRTAGNLSSSENRPARVTVNLSQDRLSVSICKQRDGCDVNVASDWRTVSKPDAVELENPNVIYRFTNTDAGAVSSSGRHHFLITPDGVARPNEGQNSTFFAVHLTRRTADGPPAQSDRCQFRTVAIVPNTILPRQYDYGRFKPFTDTPASC